MARLKKAKITGAEQSTQLPLDDMYWRPDAEVIERLFSHIIGNKALTAFDVTERLASEKIRCMRRNIMMGPIDVAKLCDIELELKILGGALLNEPSEAMLSAAEHFSEPLRKLFNTIVSVRASHGVVTPELIIAAMGGGAGTIVVNGITLGQYVALATEANLPRTPGHREPVPASFWAEWCYACFPNGDIRVGLRLPPNHHGASEPSFTLTNWAFYLWEPDCLKAWPALAPHVREADASEPSPSGRPPDLTADQVTEGINLILTELRRRRRSASEPKLPDRRALNLLRERLSVTLDQATDRRLLDACIRPARRQHREENS